ncbi:MAG: four helix bundle protein [Phycisphaerales bacterium]|nr:four helix bundle protein [Phycisphaerales bacterium]
MAITDHFSRRHRGLTNQNGPAAASVEANLAECNDWCTKPDRKHFFGISRGSLLDRLPLLELGKRRGITEIGSHTKNLTNIDEMAKMLAGHNLGTRFK